MARKSKRNSNYRNASKTAGMWKGIALTLIVVVTLSFLGTMFFSASDTSFKTGGSTQVGPSVQCTVDYSKTINLISREFFDKKTPVENVTFKVWKVLESGTKIPMNDANSTLTIAYNEKYEVVATSPGYLNMFDTFEVDSACNGPTDKVFYMKKLPSSLTVTFEQDDLVGPVATDNRVSLEAEENKNVDIRLRGQTRTTSDVIIVFDADMDSFELSSSSFSTIAKPSRHTTGAGEIAYAFNVGTLNEGNRIDGVLDLSAVKDVTAGNYNISYTIYQYQSGYIDSISGNYVNTPAIEHDRDVLLDTFTGSLFVTVTE